MILSGKKNRREGSILEFHANYQVRCSRDLLRVVACLASSYVRAAVRLGSRHALDLRLYFYRVVDAPDQKGLACGRSAPDQQLLARDRSSRVSGVEDLRGSLEPY